MLTNRFNKKINRTLLIVLGILLACLLTLNARSLYATESLAKPENTSIHLDKNVLSWILKINASLATPFDK